MKLKKYNCDKCGKKLDGNTLRRIFFQTDELILCGTHAKELSLKIDNLLHEYLVYFLKKGEEK